MREIKFRGIYPYWKNEDLKNGWVIGYLGFDGDDDEYCIQSREQETGIDGYGEGYQVIKETIGQYTGLKDKNGVEIYEGDILKGNNNPNDLAYVNLGEFGVVNVETKGTVDKVIGWHTKVIPTDGLSKLLPFCLDVPLTRFYIDRANWEIIGNIYENPDLLEGANG